MCHPLHKERCLACNMPFAVTEDGTCGAPTCPMFRQGPDHNCNCVPYLWLGKGTCRRARGDARARSMLDMRGSAEWRY